VRRKSDPGATRLTPVDLVRVAVSGLAARRLRAALSSLGIAIGIATIVAVVAIPASAKADLLARLARDGNLLTIESGQTLDGTPTPLPNTALGMIRRIPPVESAVAVGLVPGATVRRSPAIPAVDTGGLAVAAADPSLLPTLDGTVLHGTFLNAATARYPAAVLGNAAAAALGIPDLQIPAQVDIDDHLFTVVGILDPTPLTPEIDQAVLIGFPVAQSLLGFDGYATDIYVRAAPDQVGAVQQVLAPTTNPESPEAVHVSRPSDVLVARAAAKGAFNGLLLGLGAVALVVGGIGITNVMIISVLERRNEIGLRRALGASRRHIGTQFLAESLVLAVLGAVVGVALGVWVTVIYARAHASTVSIPVVDAVIVLAAAMLVGGVAGVYPALRAARLNPAEALQTT
jgi:putative ABC transport system permease protein